MGLYDRDYERERSYDDQPGFHLGGQLSMTTKLVIVMFVIYLVQLLSESSGDWFTNAFSLHADVFRRPWQAYQLLTYGFLHDVGDFRHIVFNMVGLWFFGRAVEERYGGREFLSFFLVAIVFAGLVWMFGELAAYRGLVAGHTMLGAFGRHRGRAHPVCDELSASDRAVHVLHSHADVGAGRDSRRDGRVRASFADRRASPSRPILGGAVFGFLYYRWGGRFENWLPSGSFLKRLKPGPSSASTTRNSPMPTSAAWTKS